MFSDEIMFFTPAMHSDSLRFSLPVTGILLFAVRFSNLLIIVLILGDYVHESHASFDFKTTAARKISFFLVHSQAM